MKYLALAFLAWLLSPIPAVAYVYTEAWLEGRQNARKRTQQGRTVDAAWMAELADPARVPLPRRPVGESTPIYDALMCQRMEREEGWIS